MKTIGQLEEHFARPAADYSPVPFWFLNAEMDHVELGRQLRLMHAIGLGAVVLHPRAGLLVEYMSDEWLAGIRHCVEVCASLGMRAWLYDEDNWPSGYGGGEVLKRHPDGRAKCLAMLPASEAGGEVVATVEEYAFVQQLTPWHPAYSEGWYVDLLDLKATQTFIETTHERYAQTLGDHLGATVTAVFTDEPGFYNHFYDCAPGTVVWTTDLPEEFERRRGYSLLPHLPALFRDTPDAGRIRRDFYRVVSELIAERYYLPLREWCHDHGMMLVGHVNNEEYLVDHVRYNADFFSAMDGLDMPGIDIIGARGNYRRDPANPAPKLASSAAHTRGKTQAMSETYGAMGWDLSPEEMRRLADWQGVRGVTRIVPHAFYYSVGGDRYNECPPSLFFQSPHWPYIPALMQYISRWTWLLENTRPAAQVAVYYPIHAVRAATSPRVPPSLGPGLDEDNAGLAAALGKSFRELTDALFRGQIDFDIVDDVVLCKANIGDGVLRIEDLEYRCLVLPPGEPSDEALAVVERAEEAGVTVLSGDPAGIPTQARAFATVQIDPASDRVTATRRRTEDADLFLLVNEGTEKYEGRLALPISGELTVWDLGAGQIDPCTADVENGETRIDLQLLGGAAVCFAVKGR
jgi:hypothetical protein